MDFSYLAGSYGEKYEKKYKELDKEMADGFPNEEPPTSLDSLIDDTCEFLMDLGKRNPVEYNRCEEGICNSFEDIAKTFRECHAKGLKTAAFCINEWREFTGRSKIDKRFVKEIEKIYQKIYKYIYRIVEGFEE